MNCSKCGRALPDNANFCPGCGTVCEPKAEKDPSADLLPPVPPSFSRPVQSGERRRGRRTEKGSKGTGCLVASLIFFIICAVITALLIFGSRASKDPFAPKDGTSAVSTLSESCTSESAKTEETTALPSEQSKSTKESLLSQSTEK